MAGMDKSYFLDGKPSTGAEVNQDLHVVPAGRHPACSALFSLCRRVTLERSSGRCCPAPHACGSSLREL